LALHVRDFRRSVDAFDEPLPVSLDRRADPRHLRQVHPGPDDHFSSNPEVVIVSRPCLTPLVLIRVSATFRTSAERPRTTSTSRQWSWSRCTCRVERITW